MPRSPRNALPTHLCRFWYGRRGRCLGIFLGGMESATSPWARLASRDVWGPDFPGPLPTRFHGDVQNPARVSFPVVPSVVARPRRHGNVCPSCIGCALRPRLSSRLTLGGLASPRKPWVFGGAVSRRSLATHACILTSMPSTGARASGFARHGKLPYQSIA